MYLDGLEGCAIQEARLKVGEEVAVAQSGYDIYKILQTRYGETSDAALGFKEMYMGMAFWYNKMFTPADLCPSTIIITENKIERLQDISEDDCYHEGIWRSANSCVFPYYGKHGFGYRIFSHPKDAFKELIELVSGSGTWESNPYVFAYTFVGGTK